MLKSMMNLKKHLIIWIEIAMIIYTLQKFLKYLTMNIL